jgi:hypothetical protein
MEIPTTSTSTSFLAKRIAGKIPALSGYGTWIWNLDIR